MQEYCELLLQWYQRYGNAGEITFDGAMSASDSRRNTINALLVQYIRTHYSDNEPVKFNTSDFRQLIEALSTLDILSNAAITAYDVTDAYRARLFDTKAISPLLRGINPGHEHEIYILPPVFVEGQTPVISANMDYFIINPNSKNKVEAIHFLEYYRDHMPGNQRIMLYPEVNEPQAGYGFSIDDIEIYRSLAPYIDFQQGALVWAITEQIDAADIIETYFTGAATLDQALRSLDQRVAMMFYEDQ